jgi:hypothetical protein
MKELFTCVAAVAVVGLTPQDAHSAPCAEPFNYFTFGAPSPAPDSLGVARDTILIFRGQGYGIGGSPVIASWFEVASVRLAGSDGNEIPGSFSLRDFAQDVPTVGWTPSVLLSANTKYRVVADLAEQRQARPAEAQGPETLDFSFTTGTGLTAPLQLQGALTGQLGEAMVPVTKCNSDDLCGSSPCSVTGQRSALLAHVTLPVVEGGVDVEGYQGHLFLTDDGGVTFNGPGGTTDRSHLVYAFASFHAWPGQPQTITIEVPRVQVAYVPCLSMNVWDPAGHNVVADVRCLDPVAPAVVADDAEGAGGGCAFAGTRGHGGATFWLALGLLAWRRRRAQV